jgi:succinate dehydrogenase (ubiquinone) cytochrome b560 subunit
MPPFRQDDEFSRLFTLCPPLAIPRRQQLQPQLRVPPRANLRFSSSSRFAVTTQSYTDAQAQNEILAQQRLHRPIAPHLSIYQPQIPWVLSSLTRITGVMLSGSLYLYTMAYLAAPTLGWHLESQSVAAAFAAWPVLAQGLTKAFFAFPFTFHFFNGLRHLVWDTGRQFKNPQVIRTGWAVVGLTTVSSLALSFLW